MRNRLHRFRPAGPEALLALGLATAGELNRWLEFDGYYPGSPLALDTILILLVTLPLAWARRSPLLVLSVQFACFQLPSLVTRVSFVSWGQFLAFFFGLFAVARYGDGTRRYGGLVLAAAGFPLLTVHRDDLGASYGVFYYLVLAVAWLSGEAMRRLEAKARSLERHALGLEREREERVRDAVARERAQIARELHDVIAHNVNAMIVQAGAAERVLDGANPRARRALQHVQQAGREALGEMQLLLGVLRATGEEDSPALPSLRRVDVLAAQIRQAGLPVELLVDGEPRPLPPALDLAAYRILQEALTNALKHGDKSTTHVRLRYEQDSLLLRIVNEVAREGNGAGGRGLFGMRERVQLHGGTIDAGPAGAGWRVSVVLPVREPVA